MDRMADDSRNVGGGLSPSDRSPHSHFVVCEIEDERAQLPPDPTEVGHDFPGVLPNANLPACAPLDLLADVAVNGEAGENAVEDLRREPQQAGLSFDNNEVGAETNTTYCKGDGMVNESQGTALVGQNTVVPSSPVAALAERQSLLDELTALGVEPMHDSGVTVISNDDDHDDGDDDDGCGRSDGSTVACQQEHLAERPIHHEPVAAPMAGMGGELSPQEDCRSCGEGQHSRGLFAEVIASIDCSNVSFEREKTAKGLFSMSAELAKSLPASALRGEEEAGQVVDMLPSTSTVVVSKKLNPGTCTWCPSSTATTSSESSPGGPCSVVGDDIVLSRDHGDAEQPKPSGAAGAGAGAGAGAAAVAVAVAVVAGATTSTPSWNVVESSIAKKVGKNTADTTPTSVVIETQPQVGITTAHNGDIPAGDIEHISLALQSEKGVDPATRLAPEAEKSVAVDIHGGKPPPPSPSPPAVPKAAAEQPGMTPPKQSLAQKSAAPNRPITHEGGEIAPPSSRPPATGQYPDVGCGFGTSIIPNHLQPGRQLINPHRHQFHPQVALLHPFPHPHHQPSPSPFGGAVFKRDPPPPGSMHCGGLGLPSLGIVAQSPLPGPCSGFGLPESDQAALQAASGRFDFATPQGHGQHCLQGSTRESVPRVFRHHTGGGGGCASDICQPEIPRQNNQGLYGNAAYGNLEPSSSALTTPLAQSSMQQRQQQQEQELEESTPESAIGRATSAPATPNSSLGFAVWPTVVDSPATPSSSTSTASSSSRPAQQAQVIAAVACDHPAPPNDEDAVATNGTCANGASAAAGMVTSGGDVDASVRRDNAYNDIGLVVTRTKELEKILKDLFGATGNGLNELLSSLSFSSIIDRRTQSRIRSIAAMRNKLVHSVDANNLTISNTFGHSARRAFKIMVDDLELSLRESARRKPDASPVLERPPRPPDAYTLGNHPAFRGIGGGALGGLGGVVGNDEALDTFNADAAANATLAAAARKREVEAVVVKDTARFPHTLITAKKRILQGPFNAEPAPNMMDEGAFPPIDFAASVGVPQRRGRRGVPTASRQASQGEAGPNGGGAVIDVADNEDAGGEWDGQGRIEDAQVISGRGVCRKLGQGDVGYVATTHTMSGVYRKWGGHYRNPASAWKNMMTPKEPPQEDKRRIVPGAGSAKGQVAFQGRGLDSKKPAKKKNRPKHDAYGDPRSTNIFTGNDMANQNNQSREQNFMREALRQRQEEVEDEVKWEAAMSARHRRRGLKEDKGPRSYVVRKQALQPFWLLHRVQFGKSNCRGWFPTREDWCARGIPECVYVPLEPSTEDRVAAMQFGSEPLRGLTLEEDEERLMRIAIRESAAESKRAYEKKYGTEAEREARREQQALAKVKAMSERETLERTEQEQLTLVIKASLAETLGPGEMDDRDVMVAIEASKLEQASMNMIGKQEDEANDPAILFAMAESRKQQEASQEKLLRELGVSLASSPPNSVPVAPGEPVPWADNTEPWRQDQDHLGGAPAGSHPPPPAVPLPPEPTALGYLASSSLPTTPPLPSSLQQPPSGHPPAPSTQPATLPPAGYALWNMTSELQGQQPESYRGGQRGGSCAVHPMPRRYSHSAVTAPTREENPYHQPEPAPGENVRGDSGSSHGYGAAPVASAVLPEPYASSFPSRSGQAPLLQPVMPERARSLEQFSDAPPQHPLLSQPQRAVSVGRDGSVSRDTRDGQPSRVPVQALGKVGSQAAGYAHVPADESAMAIVPLPSTSGSTQDTAAVFPPPSLPSAQKQRAVMGASGTLLQLQPSAVPGQQHGHDDRAGLLVPPRQRELSTVCPQLERPRVSLEQPQPTRYPRPGSPPGPQLAGWAIQSQLPADGQQSAASTGTALLAPAGMIEVHPTMGRAEATAPGLQNTNASGGVDAGIASRLQMTADEVSSNAWGIKPTPEEELALAIKASRQAELARQQSLSSVEAQDNELHAVMEASRLADVARRQEEVDAKAAMDMALKLSAMDIRSSATSFPKPADYSHAPPPPLSGEDGSSYHHDEDEAEQQLRQAMEEERRYYEARTAATAPTVGENNSVTSSGFGAGVTVVHSDRVTGKEGRPPAPDAAATVTPIHQGVSGRHADDHADNDHPSVFRQFAPEQGTGGALETGELDVGGEATGGESAADDELVRVLELSRLEAEQQAGAQAAASLGEADEAVDEEEEREEDMIARVIAESIKEQERREDEQRAMEAFLMP